MADRNGLWPIGLIARAFPGPVVPADLPRVSGMIARGLLAPVAQLAEFLGRLHVLTGYTGSRYWGYSTFVSVYRRVLVLS